MQCGVDEAGRGCGVGPVVAAAVVFKKGPLPGLADSKALSAKKREALYPLILEHAWWSVGMASAEEIDKATRYGFGFRFAAIGVVEFIDFGGNDILYYASRYLAGQLDAARFAPPAIVEQFMAEGRNGLKSGRGFHDYEGVDSNAYRRDVLGRSLGMLRHLDLLQAPGMAVRAATESVTEAAMKP